MISLDNLTVSYGGWTLFDNISFLINPKDRIGLVGRNGAGKTTLVNLLMRFYDVDAGAIRIGGADIRELSRPDVRNLFAMVLQDLSLIHI